MGTYHIRTMTRRDLDLAVEWALGEGWNPGIGDADCFYTADPSGFLMGFLDGEPIASISAVKYGSSFGFVGFYIVVPEHRGKGYGLRIWEAAIRALEGRTIGLDGVVAQQENYGRSGFSLAYNNIRFEGRGGGAAPGTGAPSGAVKSLLSFPMDDVVAYDRAFFPEDRRRFVEAWITQPNITALGLAGRGGRLAGYGVLRPCRQGFKVGPLFADTADGAEALFVSLIAGVPNSEPVYLDAPEVNQAAVRIAERFGMKRVFETARMYKGAAPRLPTERLFGVTTYELG